MKEPTIDLARFYTHAELRRKLRALVKWRPDLATLHSIGKSPNGRDVFLLEVTNSKTGAGETKPGYLVHGNIHSVELSGSAAALYLAWRLMSEHGKDDALTVFLDRLVFYIVPRISVDGAEEAMVEARRVRSRATLQQHKNELYPADVNGDGLVLRMRWPDPNGDQVAFEDDPRILLDRLPGDENGTFYRVVEEGLIHDWDGGEFTAGGMKHWDFNRNWGADWQPRHIQPSSGRYGFSEPEMRALADFAFDHENLFGILGFHNGPNCILRPSATKPDSDIDAADIVVMRTLAERGSEITGFPNRAVTEYRHAFGHPIKLRGHFTDWGYEHLGLFVFEIELGNLCNSVGYSTEAMWRMSPEQRRQMQPRLMAWHDAHPEEGAFIEWRPFKHPQLGRVEIGGWRLTSVANVAPEERMETWEKATQFILEHARHAPRLCISETKVEPLGNRLFRIECRIGNQGAFPTHITKIGAGFSHVKGVVVELERTRGVEMVANRTYAEIGHLQGFSGMKKLHWVVRVPQRGGSLTIVCHAPRAGGVQHKVRLRVK